jgi:hypothetical protein
MKRLIIGGLSLLLVSVVVAPAARSQETPSAPKVQNTSSSINLIAPFHLAYQAYRGDFVEQGIPGYMALVTAYANGQIRAEDLVKSAIAANRLSEEALINRGYINAVDDQLRDFQSMGG